MEQVIGSEASTTDGGAVKGVTKLGRGHFGMHIGLGQNHEPS